MRSGPTGTTILPTEVRERLDATIEHVNANHADTVLLLAHHCGQAPTATDAEAVDVDGGGFVLRVVVDGVASTTRVPFTAPVTTATDVQGQLTGLITSARERAGLTVPLTSMERERQVAATLATHRTRVAEVDDLSPNLRRIIVQGGLDAWRPLGADDFAFLFVPRTPEDVSIDERFSMATWQRLPPDQRPHGAYYSIRRFDPTTRSIELWAVLHGHQHGVGGWAGRARPGETVALWGPRHSYEPPDIPHHHLFVADESGFAAVAALLDRLGAGTTATVLVETVDADHEIELSDRPGVEIRWLHRGRAAPGESAGFIDQVRALDLDPADLVAFGAGESRQITAVRTYLRRQLEIPPDRVFLTGYWRR